MKTKKKLKSEKTGKNVAIVILTVIIVGTLAVYLIVNYYLGGKIINVGDCADVHYIGRFAVNGTIFGTSYGNVENKSGGEPLNVFINPNMNLTLPVGYESYSSAFEMIPPAVIDSLIDMKLGNTETVTVPPEKAFGEWNETLVEEIVGGPLLVDSVQDSIFEVNKSVFSSAFEDVQLVLNSTFDYGAPSFGVEGVLNATIINITASNVTIKLFPENGTTFVLRPFNWNATFIVENETAFTIHSDVKVNHTFTVESYLGTFHYKVIGVNETLIKLAINALAPSPDFVGQTLVFELEVVEIYKTSEEIS